MTDCDGLHEGIGFDTQNMRGSQFGRQNAGVAPARARLDKRTAGRDVLGEDLPTDAHGSGLEFHRRPAISCVVKSPVPISFFVIASSSPTWGGLRSFMASDRRSRKRGGSSRLVLRTAA